MDDIVADTFGAAYTPRRVCLTEHAEELSRAAGIDVVIDATGRPAGSSADVVAVAKTDLEPGDILDGEGGFTVYGQLDRAADSLDAGALPIGLAGRARVIRAVARDEVIC